ncbi:MAG TPA: hypothetical protein VHQ47_17905 [Phycisphaerae bacterium]|nr:hypothetical protein [Phycisphaerae bacterium]
MKSLFFDRKAIIDKVDAGTRRVLSKFGAFVRTRARSSIRKRKKPSAPGSPPSSHNGMLKDNIFFGYDSSKRSVVTGPTKTNTVHFDGDGQPVSGTVPEVLEEGGEIKILEVFKYGRWQKADLRSRRQLTNLPTRLRTIKIAKRPYMGPSFEQEKKNLPSLWANAIH